MGKSARPDLHNLVEQIVRRAPAGHVVRLSDPPTAAERLQLLAAQLQRTPIVIMPARCETVDEWVERYATRLAN